MRVSALPPSTRPSPGRGHLGTTSISPSAFFSSAMSIYRFALAAHVHERHFRTDGDDGAFDEVGPLSRCFALSEASNIAPKSSSSLLVRSRHAQLDPGKSTACASSRQESGPSPATHMRGGRPQPDAAGRGGAPSIERPNRDWVVSDAAARPGTRCRRAGASTGGRATRASCRTEKRRNRSSRRRCCCG